MPDTPGSQTQREMLSLVTARVRDAYVRRPFHVDGALDLVSVCRLLSQQQLTSALVQDGGRLGIFTTTDLRDALLRDVSPDRLAVREVARFELIEIDADAELFEALWLMVRHRVHRLLVRDGTEVLGVLSQLDLVSFVANSCLLVMGSEGRGEQILKTDQDNALLLRDGFEHAQLASVAARFNAALAELGWPPCPGGIMVTNPVWRAPVAAFRATLADWARAGTAEATMQLAIFFDAAAVAGDAALLHALREHLGRVLAGSDAFLARFAAAADQFDEPQHWWLKLTARGDEQALDLKKLGTFPIVHGVRALSLKHGVHENGTALRLRRLVEGGHVDGGVGRDLLEALHFLMGLKLRHQLLQRAEGRAPDNLVKPSALSTMERDQFKDALAIVRRFRALLRLRFRLDVL